MRTKLYGLRAYRRSRSFSSMTRTADRSALTEDRTSTSHTETRGTNELGTSRLYVARHNDVCGKGTVAPWSSAPVTPAPSTRMRARARIPFSGPLIARRVMEDPRALEDPAWSVVHVCAANDSTSSCLAPRFAQARTSSARNPSRSMCAARGARRPRAQDRRSAVLAYNYRFHPLVVELAARVMYLGPLHLARGRSCRTGCCSRQTRTGASRRRAGAPRARSPTSARIGSTSSSW